MAHVSDAACRDEELSQMNAAKFLMFCPAQPSPAQPSPAHSRLPQWMVLKFGNGAASAEERMEALYGQHQLGGRPILISLISSSGPWYILMNDIPKQICVTGRVSGVPWRPLLSLPRDTRGKKGWIHCWSKYGRKVPKWDKNKGMGLWAMA